MENLKQWVGENWDWKEMGLNMQDPNCKEAKSFH